jgi:hypothetical protein
MICPQQEIAQRLLDVFVFLQIQFFEMKFRVTQKIVGGAPAHSINLTVLFEIKLRQTVPNTAADTGDENVSGHNVAFYLVRFFFLSRHQNRMRPKGGTPN